MQPIPAAHFGGGQLEGPSPDQRTQHAQSRGMRTSATCDGTARQRSELLTTGKEIACFIIMACNAVIRLWRNRKDLSDSGAIRFLVKANQVHSRADRMLLRAFWQIPSRTDVVVRVGGEWLHACPGEDLCFSQLRIRSRRARHKRGLRLSLFPA